VKGFLAVLIFLAGGFLVWALFFHKIQPTVITNTQYLEGIPDTTTVIDTVYLPQDTIRVPIDSVSYSDTSLYIETKFKLEHEDASVSGRLQADTNRVNFLDLLWEIPIREISRVDTLLIEKTELIEPVFYEDNWFWTTLLAILLLFASLF